MTPALENINQPLYFETPPGLRKYRPAHALAGTWFPTYAWVPREEKQWNHEGIAFPWEKPPSNLIQLSQFIKNSSWVLDLEENWNDEGALPISRWTWEKASLFLWKHAEELTRYSETKLDIPSITPSPDGGIGYYWKTDTYELLINYPPESVGSIDYYGDDRKWGNKIKGNSPKYDIDLKLISWLTLVK